MEILILFIAAIIGFGFGWHAREAWAIRQVHRLLESGELFQKEEEPEEDRTKMRLEVQSDVIYAFSDEDNSFIAQGKDLFDLDKAIQARFPGKKFAVREDNLKEIGAKYHESV
jgi:hypothetical protein